MGGRMRGMTFPLIYLVCLGSQAHCLWGAVQEKSSEQDSGGPLQRREKKMNHGIIQAGKDLWDH